MARIIQQLQTPTTPTVGRSLSITGGQNSNIPIKQDLGDLTAKNIKGGFSSSISSADVGSTKFAEGIKQGGIKGYGKAGIGLLEGTLGAASGGLNALYSPISSVIEKYIPKTDKSENIKDKNSMQYKLAVDRENLSNKISEVTNKHPQATKDISDLLNVALSVVGGEKVAPEIKTGLSETPNIKGLVNDAKQTVSDIKTGITKPVDTSALTGKIIQGGTKDIEKAKSTISKLDISGVNTSQDLANKLDTHVKNLSEQLDSKLDKNKTIKKLNDLSFKENVGGKAVEHNYVKDSINQLKDHYKSINDPVSLERINQLETKANKNGLTVKEINDLAKEQGIQIDAYKKSGDLASTTKAQAAENTRTGLKKTARDIFGDKSYEQSDKAISDAIRTKKLIDKRVELVNKAKQKIEARGWGSKAGALILKVTDTLSGGLLKGAAKELIGKSGDNYLNILDLEKTLSKDLEKLQKATNVKTESEMVSKLNEIITDSSRLLPAPQEKGIPMGGKTVEGYQVSSSGEKTPIKTQAKITTAEKNPVSVNPKTGKFQSSFTSDTAIEKVKVPNSPSGHTLNVGMKIGDSGKLTVKRITDALKEIGVKVKNYEIQQSGTEPTFIPELSRALTPRELYNLSVKLEQDAIPQLSNGTGIMNGPKAADWGGKFNPEYYINKSNKLKGKLKK